jgi:hypothetical protein
VKDQGADNGQEALERDVLEVRDANIANRIKVESNRADDDELRRAVEDRIFISLGENKPDNWRVEEGENSNPNDYS